MTEELCGYEFSASIISRINQGWTRSWRSLRDGVWTRPIRMLDGRYEKIREERVIHSRVARDWINWERRCVLAWK